MRETFTITTDKNLYNQLMEIPLEQFRDFSTIVDEVYLEKERRSNNNRCDICNTQLVQTKLNDYDLYELVCPECTKLI